MVGQRSVLHASQRMFLSSPLTLTLTLPMRRIRIILYRRYFDGLIELLRLQIEEGKENKEADERLVSLETDAAEDGAAIPLSQDDKKENDREEQTLMLETDSLVKESSEVGRVADTDDSLNTEKRVECFYSFSTFVDWDWGVAGDFCCKNSMWILRVLSLILFSITTVLIVIFMIPGK